MREYFKEIKKWLVFWVTATITILLLSGAVYAWVPLRTSFSQTSITWDADLYTRADTTLTATKWNELVNSTKWKTAPVDTTPFDLACERRMVTSDMILYADYTYATQLVTYYDAWHRDVSNTTKWSFTTWNWRSLLRLEYRCPNR